LVLAPSPGTIRWPLASILNITPLALLMTNPPPLCGVTVTSWARAVVHGKAVPTAMQSAVRRSERVNGIM